MLVSNGDAFSFALSLCTCNISINRIMNTINFSVTNSSCGYCASFEYGPFTVTVLAVIGCVGLVANILLLEAHRKDPLKCFQKPVTYFVHHIAINDFLIILLSISLLIIAVKTNGPIYLGSEYLRYLRPFVLLVSSFSCYAFASLAVERFVSVAYPLFHQVHITRGRTLHWIAVIWIAAGTGIGIDQGLRYVYQEVEFLVEVIVSSLSLAVMLSFYLACFVSIKRQQKRFKKGHMAELAKQTLKVKLSNEQQFLTTISIVGVSTFVLWTPGILMFSFSGNLDVKISENFHRIVNTLVPGLVITHSSLGPIIYVWRLPKYRKTFKNLYRSHCYPSLLMH